MVLPAPARRDVAIDAEGRVAEGSACRGCGYELRGLARDARCPECGRPVELSIRGDELRFCDPAWLRRLGAGAMTTLAGLASLLTVGVVGSLVWGDIDGPASVLLVAAIFTLIAVGAWLLTEPEPGRAGERALGSRRVARWCMAAQLPGQAVVAWMEVAWAPTRAGAYGILVVAADIAVDALFVAGSVAGLLYLGALADRIPRPRVRRQLRIVAWGLGIDTGLGVALGAVMTASLAVDDSFELFMAAGCAVLIAAAVLSAWALVLLGMLATAFRRIARGAIQRA